MSEVFLGIMQDCSVWTSNCWVKSSGSVPAKKRMESWSFQRMDFLITAGVSCPGGGGVTGLSLACPGRGKCDTLSLCPMGCGGRESGNLMLTGDSNA